MWKLKYLFTGIVLLFSLSGIPQNQSAWITLNSNSNRFEGKLSGETFYLSTVANGNFFLQNDWVTGSITLTDGDTFENIKLRYLAYGDEIVAYNENLRTLYIVEKKLVKEFTFKSTSDFGENNEIKFINLNSLNLQGGKSYFEELYSGGARLLAYYNVEEYKVSPFTDRLGNTRDTEYKLVVKYYLFNDKNELYRILRNKKSFYRIYPNHKKEIRKLIRKNHISLVGQNSLLQAFTLLDKAGILQ